MLSESREHSFLVSLRRTVRCYATLDVKCDPYCKAVITQRRSGHMLILLFAREQHFIRSITWQQQLSEKVRQRVLLNVALSSLQVITGSRSHWECSVSSLLTRVFRSRQTSCPSLTTAKTLEASHLSAKQAHTPIVIHCLSHICCARAWTRMRQVDAQLFNRSYCMCRGEIVKCHDGSNSFSKFLLILSLREWRRCSYSRCFVIAPSQKKPISLLFFVCAFVSVHTEGDLVNFVMILFASSLIVYF